MQAYDKVVNQLDIINVLKTLHKLKAGLSAVIKNDQGLNREARELYLD